MLVSWVEHDHISDTVFEESKLSVSRSDWQLKARVDNNAAAGR